MSKPIIADNKPQKVSVEKGKKYFFCACGRSANQPFCNGSHKVTSLRPWEYTADEDKDVWVCLCKHTTEPPFCRGVHKQFSDDQVGQEGPGVA